MHNGNNGKRALQRRNVQIPLSRYCAFGYNSTDWGITKCVLIGGLRGRTLLLVLRSGSRDLCFSRTCCRFRRPLFAFCSAAYPHDTEDKEQSHEPFNIIHTIRTTNRYEYTNYTNKSE